MTWFLGPVLFASFAGAAPPSEAEAEVRAFAKAVGEAIAERDKFVGWAPPTVFVGGGRCPPYGAVGGAHPTGARITERLTAVSGGGGRGGRGRR